MHFIKIYLYKFKVAEQYSEDKAKHGGSLGWQSRGQMVILNKFIIYINM